MSNALVGQIYNQIIQAVYQASQNDFEEWGVDQHTLITLQQIWQQKLSTHKTATFPWDPPPVQHQIANPPTLPSNANQTLPAGDANGAPTDGQIKSEPGVEPGVSNYPAVNGYAPPMPNAQLAQQRAAQLLQQQYGNQASASIGALQQQQHGLSLPGRFNGPAVGAAPPAPPNGPSSAKPEVKQEPRTPQPSHTPLAASQTDGAGDSLEDWKAFMAERRAHYQNEQETVNGILRAQLENQSALTDSGLMQPLDELPQRKKRMTAKPSLDAPASTHNNPAAASDAGAPPAIPQLDGPDDDGVDEDAINSDLDDSEEELKDDEEEEQDLGETMLCTYDKVQRVKNKWKCVLKDGVLSTGNKEYLFHKAQGEFEW